MICNVCSKNNRCYSLIEADMSHFHMRPSGMLFNICSDCLNKLVTLIKTNKTFLDDPDKPFDPREFRMKVTQQEDPKFGFRKG